METVLDMFGWRKMVDGFVGIDFQTYGCVVG